MKQVAKHILLILIIISAKNSIAQSSSNSNISASLWEGMVVAGYVNEGAFLNFGGSSIKWVKKPYMIMLGVLPSLRIKEDKVAAGAKKNSSFTPSMGAGVTAAYKHLILQIPVYYNAKTATTDGKWNLGVGLGYKF